jgi:hypothetical protein
VRCVLEGADPIVTDIARKRWSQRAQEIQFTQLDQMREHAEKWRNGMIALTALFATISIVKGTEQLNNLTHLGKLIVVWLFGSAFLLLLTGSLLAMRAAFGIPGTMLLSGENLEAWEQEETRKSSLSLSIGRIIFLIGVLCIAVAVAITWINSGPQAKTRVAVKTNTGRLVCGELASGSSQGIIISAQNVFGGTEEHLGFTEIVAMKMVRNCP